MRPGGWGLWQCQAILLRLAGSSLTRRWVSSTRRSGKSGQRPRISKMAEFLAVWAASSLQEEPNVNVNVNIRIQSVPNRYLFQSYLKNLIGPDFLSCSLLKTEVPQNKFQSRSRRSESRFMFTQLGASGSRLGPTEWGSRCCQFMTRNRSSFELYLKYFYSNCLHFCKEIPAIEAAFFSWNTEGVGFVAWLR